MLLELGIHLKLLWKKLEMPTKKRILMCGEASHKLSGFGTYSNEVLSRLVDTGKYEIAEFATYGKIGDAADESVRWRYYPNEVHPKDPQYKLYKSRPVHQFGEWRFERVLLDFKPDIVWDIRDYWMLSYEGASPLRKFFHWCIQPTVDSAPQKEDWIETYLEADSVFSWSDYGGEVLRKEGNGKIKYCGSAPSGVDIEKFCPPKSKQQHRRDMGFFDDVFIVGMVGRNQIRKLYPDLFHAFRIFCDKYANIDKELVKKTYLYVHLSYPDLGWPIPELIKEFGIGHKIICTYICQKCQKPFCSFWQDAIAVCPHCNLPTGLLPTVGKGLTREQLASVYKLFDLYIQYAICEGFGMPQVEAAACGVPVMAVDYSAMADVVRKVSGTPLKVQRMFRELASMSYRALPDNEYCADAIYKFLSKPESLKKRQGIKARKAVEKYYTWEKTAKIWEDHFDSIELTGKQGKWNSEPADVFQVPSSIPQGLTNSQFADWLVRDVIKRPEFINTFHTMKLVRDLNYGCILINGKPQPISREKIFKNYQVIAKNHNHCEHGRCGMIPLDQTDYIEYANLKDRAREHKEENK